MNLDIEIESDAWQALDQVEGIASKALAAALGESEQRSVTLLFTDDASMREINREWRGFDKSTNVLSFPSAPAPVPQGEVAHLGDLVLAWETVAREAGEAGKPLADHVTHLIIHGALHLLGYDHETDEEAAVMETKETAILAGLGIADPYTT